jgi:hypothetical protein
VSVINLQTAQRLRLSLGRPVKVQGVKSLATGYWPERLFARAGEVTLPKNYLAVDLRNLSDACGCRVDGLIGADFFREHLVQIDFNAKQIRLLKSISPSEHQESVSLKMQATGMRIPLRVNDGEQLWMRLDTGCASALQWVNTRTPTDHCPRQKAVGLTAVAIPQVETTVRIGKMEFKEVPTGLQVEPLFAGEAGLLGCGLLSRFSVITVDTAAGRLLLDARNPTNPYPDYLLSSRQTLSARVKSF